MLLVSIRMWDIRSSNVLRRASSGVFGLRPRLKTPRFGSVLDTSIALAHGRFCCVTGDARLFGRADLRRIGQDEYVKSWSVGLTGVLSLVAIIAASYGPSGLALTVGIVFSALFGYGWPHYLAIPAKKTLGAVIAICGALAVVIARFSPGPGYLAWLPAVIALGVGAVFVIQLIRGTGQSHRLESTFGCVAGVLIVTVGAGWIAAHRFTGESAMTWIAGLSAVVVLLLGMIRWPDRIIAPLGLVLGGLAGPLAALLFSDVHILPAAVIGLVIAAVLLSFRRLASIASPLGNVAGSIAMGLAPVLSLGAMVYFIDKLLSA